MRKDMVTIHLLVDQDYIEDFMKTLPKEKVIVIEEDFKSNQKMLQNVVENYQTDKNSFIPYYNSMKDLNSWLETRQET
ncbi:MAG: hypothetical protein ACJAWW_000283 [Sulfurimonas sp.]|jgi:hypothetical protein